MVRGRARVGRSGEGQKVPGTVRLQPGRRPRALARGLPELWHALLPGDDTADLPSYPYLERIPELRGRLLSELEVVLLEVEGRHQFPGAASGSAAAALVGRTLPRGDELNTQAVEFQVGGLTELAGVSPLHGLEIDLPQQGPASDYRIVWDPESRQSWTTADGDEISVEFVPHTIDTTLYGFGIAPYPVVRVHGPRPRTVLEWLISYAQPLMQLTTLVTSQPQRIRWLELGGRRNPWTAQVFAENVVQDPYTATMPSTAPVVLRLGPGGAVLPDLLQQWLELEQDCGTLFEYLTAGMQETMSTRTRYLFLLPALEALHSARHGDETAANAPNQARLQLLQRIVAADDVTEENAAVLTARLTPPTARGYQLHERLRELAGDLDPVLAQRIRPSIDPIPPLLQRIVTGARDVWDIVGTTRNRLAHGNSNVPSAEQLLALARLAHTLVVALTVQHLGQPDLLADAIDDGSWLVL
ncbi:hypothetical protein [Lentzea sp. NBRC 102530]|uniref:hypothetical protein n=1 Tax=Lentzea sp. NBRC 102530 TaxID=3032201 RepID=UPI0024A00B4D|nr:hypothetical protein [Lentzea sp. NBRC 102530]GLY53167.1 hypothetical protein Lesp01_68230 [Lentzea sp. NBRC 102530]